MTKRTYSRLISNRKQRIKIIDIRNSANFSTEWSMWFPVNVVFHVITYNPIYFINRALYLSCSNVSPAPTYRRYSRKKKEKTASYLLPSYNSWQMATMFVTERVTRRERNSPFLPLSFRFQPILFPPVITFRVSNPQLRVIKIARNIFAIRETG